ncbi:gp53-like domain-containing protein [Phytobacter diazotrophicus]
MRPLMPPVQTPDNLFHDGNPITGELGTLVDANHLNNVQAAIRDAQSELISIMTAAGLAPDSSSVHQLLDALKTLFEAKDAALTSLASLVGSANTLPYFTGPDTLALTSLTATGRNLINKADVASIIQYLGLQNTINLAANALQRSGDNIAWLNVAQLLQAASMHVNQPGVADTQGLTIDWNRLGPGGATGFTNNRGLGAGGFVFQTVDPTNKIVHSTITFDVNGQILAPSNLCAGTAKFAIDGNSYGTIWGVAGGSDWLSNYLATKFSGIQNQFTAIPVNNTTGDISGPAWGGLLSAHLAAKWVGIQNQFNAIPVDNPSGNIHGSAWGNDWLSNYINNRFAAVANKLVMVSNVNGYFKDVTSGFLIQFGWIQSVTANAETSGFNIAFPNACAGIVANLGLPLNNGNSVYVKAENNQGFSYRTSTQGIGFYWFAWGY